MLATLLCLSFALPPLCAPELQELPELTGPVVDLADVLSDDVERELDARLRGHQARTTHQVVVLTLPSLEGRDIEPVALEIARGWGLGRADADNGVLLLVATGERQTRIEVGVGLEGTLTDLQAGLVLREHVRPLLAGDDYDGGLSAGVDAILRVLDGEVLVASSSADDEVPLWASACFGLMVLCTLSGLSFGALMIGGGAQFALFFLFGNPLALLLGFLIGSLFWTWAVYVGLYLLVAAYFAVVPHGRRVYARLSKKFASSSSGSSGSSYSGSSGSSSYDSGYSGGGGDFAGAGASDDY